MEVRSLSQHPLKQEVAEPELYASLSLTLTFKISGIMLNTDPEEDSVLCLALRYLCKSLSTPFLAPPVPHSSLGGLSSVFSILSSLVRWSCPSQTLVALTI